MNECLCFLCHTWGRRSVGVATGTGINFRRTEALPHFAARVDVNRRFDMIRPKYKIMACYRRRFSQDAWSWHSQSLETDECCGAKDSILSMHCAEVAERSTLPCQPVQIQKLKALKRLPLPMERSQPQRTYSPGWQVCGDKVATAVNSGDVPGGGADSVTSLRFHGCLVFSFPMRPVPAATQLDGTCLADLPILAMPPKHEALRDG